MLDSKVLEQCFRLKMRLFEAEPLRYQATAV